MLEQIMELQSKEWQVQHSSLAKIAQHAVTYEQCRKYACEDITSSLTHPINSKSPFIVDIPKGSEFHFIGRVDTSFDINNPVSYYKSFEERHFISFSTINNRNISHYKGRAFFVYDILPEDIVHIFPLDSNIRPYAESEEDLTWVPSLWLTLHDLGEVTAELGVYNQITCKTKRNGQILKPFAVIAFNESDEKIQRIAELFKIRCIVVHPNKRAINYDRDLLYDYFQLQSVSSKMEKMYGVDLKSLFYPD